MKLLNYFIVLILFLIFSANLNGQNEPVWPGTQTRFYPGIYPRSGTIDPDVGSVTNELHKWWGGADLDKYRDYHNGHRVSHLGMMVLVSTKSIFSDYWYNHVEGPFNYATNCSNSEIMQNPDAVLEGHPVYDWSKIEAILSIPGIANGDFKILIRIVDQAIKTRHPKWWASQGMMTESLDHPKKYDWVYTRCKMDYTKAFAAKFAGNTSIAGIQFSEYAGLTNEGAVCGYVVPDQNWQVSAENGVFFYPAKAMLEADPGLLVLKGNVAAFVPDYFTGRGTGMGLDDLPGAQGAFHADPRFFRLECASGAPCTVDCPSGDFVSFWLHQYAVFNNKDLVVAYCSERNGWSVAGSTEGKRTGENNPWNVAVWPNEAAPWNGLNPGGLAGAETTSIFPDPAFWVWYTSGPPKASGDKADSGLGQEGPDPCGVIPSHMYLPMLPFRATAADTEGERVAWNAENLSIERYLKAFEVFGPSGTKAMFYYPQGYLDQFDATISITEVEYLSYPHFKVETPSATYYISKQSGGCSSMIDKDSVDWIQFSRTGNNPPANSADSDFRGMPNLVYQGADDGVGHPVGINKCATVQVAHNKLKVTSNSGLWEFSWIFHNDHALIDVEKIDPSRDYWFLYEGPVAGKWSPSTHYWATDVTGIRTDQPLIGKSVVNGNWKWAYFGDDRADRCLFVSMVNKDEKNDFFAYMGNYNTLGLTSPDGMNVFGFGRSSAVPQMNELNRFIFGFYEKKLKTQDTYNEFSGYIASLIDLYKDSQEPPPTPGDIALSAYWSFNTETAGITPDGSGNGNNLSLTAGASLTEGKYSSGLNLPSGSQSFALIEDNLLSADFPGASNGSPVDSFTIAAWIRLSAIEDRSPVITKEYKDKRGFEFAVKNGRLAVQIFKNETTGTSVSETGTLLETDRWYHVAMSYSFVTDGTSVIRLYLDGQEDHSVNTSVGPQKTNNAPVRVGAYEWSDTYKRFFNGMIDEVYVFNKTLSAEDLLLIMNSTSPPVGIFQPVSGVSDFEIYPNPGTSNFFYKGILQESGNLHLSVHNLQGQLIQTVLDQTMSIGPFSGVVQVDHLPEGIYFIAIKTENSFRTLKFVKL
jgi:hypothetical protein